jgi:hypothetical protein
MWWHYHLPIIFLQVIAFFPYIIGSRRFYQGKKGFMLLLCLGVSLDVIMAITPFVVELPRMSAEHTAPWVSFLFITHIASAGFAMFYFIWMLIFISVKGPNYNYNILRIFQYKVILRLWILGVSIALINFFVKVVFQIRIYDYL